MSAEIGYEVTIVRVLDAPRELVWKAWTEPDRLTRWWGAKSFTSPTHKVDLKVGGKYHYSMRSPEGQDVWGTGVYREIVRPERLVMTDSFADEQGNVVSATHYGMSADMPREMLITVTFEDEAGKTKLTLKHSGLGGVSDADRESMEQGWSESFDKLERLLESEKEKMSIR